MDRAVMANISDSKQAVREEIKDVLKCLDPNKVPEKIEKLIPAIKFYQTFNTDLLKLDAEQHNKINDFIQNTFFYLTAVCKNNSLLGDDIDGSVLPQSIWSNIFSYLDISDVVEGSAVALSGSCDDML